jgi:hypothetical protein
MTPWDSQGVDDANPAEAREPAVDGGDAQMNEEAAGSGQSTQETPDKCSCSSRNSYRVVQIS